MLWNRCAIPAFSKSHLQFLEYETHPTWMPTTKCTEASGGGRAALAVAAFTTCNVCMQSTHATLNVPIITCHCSTLRRQPMTQKTSICPETHLDGPNSGHGRIAKPSPHHDTASRGCCHVPDRCLSYLRLEPPSLCLARPPAEKRIHRSAWSKRWIAVPAAPSAKPTQRLH